MGIHLEKLQVFKKEPKSIFQIKREMICPDCGDLLMNGGNCFFCFCGWSSCE